MEHGEYIGEYFLAGDPIYSRWFTRQSDSVVFAVRSVSKVGDPSNMKCELEVLTKKSEEADSQQTTVKTDTGLSVVEVQEVGVHMFHYEGFNDLYRFKFQVAGDAGEDYAMITMASPAWFTN